MEQLLARLKVRLGLDDGSEDELLMEHLSGAVDVVNDVRQFTPTVDIAVESGYASIAVMMAESSYNKIGAEGQMSHSENGVSRHYGSDSYPSSLIARIIPRVRF
jgi:hypothetical protein